MNQKITAVVAVMSASLLWVPSVSAQEGVAVALEEIVVSARKRDESLQDVPISVDVFSKERLEQLAIDSVSDLANYTPSLRFDQGVLPMDTRPVIRGVSALRGRPNVGILVDFVDVSSEALTVAGGGMTANLRLLDLERVEVVKGPQSALYGRSAFTGAVNYITRRPGDKFRGDVNVSFGEFNTSELGVSLSGPLMENLNGGFILSKYQTDGWYSNPNTGGDLGAVDSFGGAVSLEWTPTDSITAYFRAEHSKDEASPRAEGFLASVSPQFDPAVNPFGTGTVTDIATQVPIVFTGGVQCNGIDRQQPYFDAFFAGPPCRPLVTGELSANESDIDLSADPRTGRDFIGTDMHTTRVHFDVNWNIGSMDLTYLLGYVDSNAFVQEDFDKTNVPIISVPFPPFPFSQYGLSAMAQQQIDTEQWNHELRLSGGTDRASWMVSALSWNEEMDVAFDDEWFLRDGGNAGLVLDTFNQFVFNFLDPNPTTGFPGLCAIVYPGNAACVNDITFLATSPQNTPAIPLRRETSHTSLAGMFAYDITDALTATVEGRWLSETIDYEGGAADVSFFSQFGNDPWWGFTFGPGELTNNQVKEDTFVPKVTLDYRVNDDVMLYGYYSQGFKPGGVNTTDANGDVSTGEYKAEELEVFEFGIKSAFRNRSVRLNAAAFYYDYTDQQVPFQFTGQNGILQTAVANAGETEFTGLDAEIVWNSSIVEGISATLAYTYTDAEFTDFNLTPILAEIGGAPSDFNRARAGNAEADFSGKTPPLVAEHSATASFRYDTNLDSGLGLFGELFVIYNSDRFASESNRTILPAHTFLDFYAGLSGEKWSATLFVQNLADDDTIRSGLGNVDYSFLVNGMSITDGVNVYLPQPRTAGVRFKYGFGAD